ncbi:DUF6541 family protein [Microbacterium sp.]|uniref:DUF6541 family protein n=1 Tax=Microbacterium sp. TaxID=51671 RepID=UPI0035B13454
MQWYAFAGATLAILALFAVIGFPLARLIGLRGFWGIAAAPVFAVTVIGGSATVAPWLGLSFSLVPVLLVAAIIAAALALLRRVLSAPSLHVGPRHRFDAWLLAAFAIAAVLLAVRFVAIVGSPDSISQTFDNVFHLNAVRYALDTGSVSSLTIGRMTNPGGALAFYPAAWHALAALVVQLSGASIPVAINAVTFATAAVVWPLGILLLVRTLFGRAPVLSISVGLLAASLPVFPFLPMDYGVLYPNQLGIALVAPALAATLRLLGIGAGGRAPGALWWGIVLAGMLPALALVHPGAFMAWLALSGPFVVVFVALQWRDARTAPRRWAIAGAFLAYLEVGAAAAANLRPPLGARGWPLQRSLPEAVMDVLTGAAWYRAAAVVAAAAVIVGIVWTLIRRSPAAVAALGTYVVAAALYVICAALPFLGLRDAFTGPWYNNLPRLAALLPIGMIPLAAYGVACTWAFVRSRPRVRSAVRGQPRWARAAGAAAGIVAFGLALQLGPGTPLPVATASAAAAYVSTDDSALLSTDERALLARVDEHVPPGVAIAGSPWTGASLAYAFADRPVLMPHTLMEITPDVGAINDGLADAVDGSAACDAVDALGVGFVLDFAGREVHPGEHVFPGLTDLADSGALRLVDSEGDARLYEIVGCSG